MKKILLFFTIFFIFGCASKDLNYEVKDISSKKSEINFYKFYENEILNDFVKIALKNSYDLKTALLNLRTAYLQANLNENDIYPTLNANLGVNSSRNIKFSDDFSTNYSSSLGASLSFDIFGKIIDETKSAKWNAISSEFDFLNIKNILISEVTRAYFNLAYLQDLQNLLENNLVISQKLVQISENEFKSGKIAELDFKETQNSYLNLQTQLLQTKNQKFDEIRNLKNLLGIDKDDEIFGKISKISLEKQNLLNLKDEIPLFYIENRSDILSIIAKMNAGFYDYRVSLKEFLPNITIGASLNGNSNSGFEINNFGGNLSVSFGFLDYFRLKNRLKISKTSFEKLKISYEKTFSQALNQIKFLYISYQNLQNSYENSQKIYKNSQKISNFYEIKQKIGTASMKEFLNAYNAKISSQKNIINEKLNLLNKEILIIENLGGKI